MKTKSKRVSAIIHFYLKLLNENRTHIISLFDEFGSSGHVPQHESIFRALACEQSRASIAVAYLKN